MPSNSDITKSFIGIPLQYDALDADLDPKFPELPKDDPLSWGIVVGAAPGSWSGETTVGGIDGSATFFGPKKLPVPLPERTPTGRIRWRSVPRPCAILTVRTQKTSINEARDFGRSSVRALLALLRREVPTLIPSDILWEGVIAKVREGKVGMTAAGTQMAVREEATPSRLASSSMVIVRVALHQLPSYVVRALHWLQLARASQVKADQFIHMWLAVLALATYGTSRGEDMPRIRNYVAQMGTGIGGVLSRRRIDELVELLSRASNARNRLMHHDDESRITPDMLIQLESAAFQLVDFELRKAQMA